MGIETFTGEGESVYDPFLGSGTTLIAAHRLSRRCYGMEIEPRYADVILKRCEAEGLTCELLDTVQTESKPDPVPPAAKKKTKPVAPSAKTKKKKQKAGAK